MKDEHSGADFPELNAESCRAWDENAAWWDDKIGYGESDRPVCTVVEDAALRFGDIWPSEDSKTPNAGWLRV